MRKRFRRSLATSTLNPTMVRLLQTTKSAALTVRSSFNPTMVRLLRKEAQKKGCVEVMFQSHNGAIAACNRETSRACADRISIPQWCDCCFTAVYRVNGTEIVSIPQWCDCCPCLKKVMRLENYRFNPTMVRLLPRHVNLWQQLGHAFQSHNGAIAAS